MPVYRRHRLLHIHIPKTGGTAIEHYFDSIGDFQWGRESWVGREFTRSRWWEFQHLTMPELFGFTGEFRDFHSFAVVRDPYSRLISEFNWRKARDPDGPEIRFERFADFVRAIPLGVVDDWPATVSGPGQAMTNFLIHVRPQHHYVCTRHGEQIVSELLKFENLRADFARLLDRVGLQTDRIRTPRPKDIDAWFDRATYDRANIIYARDFELGCYPMR